MHQRVDDDHSWYHASNVLGAMVGVAPAIVSDAGAGVMVDEQLRCSMANPHSSRDSAICAILGESDLDAVLPALVDLHLARIIALAPGAQRVVRAIAALYGQLTSLIAPSTVADPALHAALARLIGTAEGWNALRVWAEVAPAGWGRPHAAALIDASARRVSNHLDVAVLIGPCDASAALLHTPWLPPEIGWSTDALDIAIGAALESFADAPPICRAMHADLVQRLVSHARPRDLAALTRLACIMPAKDIWSSVRRLLGTSANAADQIVAAAPWDDLPEEVGAAILKRADRSDVCAAVAAARGRCNPATVDVTHETAAAFVVALDPDVWDALDADAQRPWLHRLHCVDAHLAVRSLGPRPEILALAVIGDNLVHAVRSHACHDADLHAALFPVALRDATIPMSHALIAALPTLPSAPGAFFVVASRHPDPCVIARADATLRSPADLAVAVALQCSTNNRAMVQVVSITLQHALRGWISDALAPLLALLSDDVRAVLIPDPDACVAHLAHPDRQDALRQALARLVSLPPEIAVPARLALGRINARGVSPYDAAGGLASALRMHGDLFLSIVDASADDLQHNLLPSSEDAAWTVALRDLTRDDPFTAYRLAYVRHDGRWREAIRLTLSLPQHLRAAVAPAADTLIARLAHADGRDQMRAALMQLARTAPDVDVAVRFALERWSANRADDSRNAAERQETAETLTCALRAHGDVFLAMMDSLADDGLRAMLLPLPNRASLATALRSFARDDPLSACRLAHALRTHDRRAAIRELLTAPSPGAVTVWQALHPATPLDAALRSLARRDAIAARALAAGHSGDDDLRNAGITALIARPELVRTFWDRLSLDVQPILARRPTFADLPIAPTLSVIRRGRRAS